ncbi:MAG: mechanosensitive ion channel [Proteobacteria bacterium]|nr:mechanosensitive ion channel [Pseudomonadota bacterium]MBU4296628.1 mechanosensitive ion channel [Pseudomonadota bacterium]MCG2748257.1 mechanosensitive ion channel [Desulfobulbaceae bacterium]
MLKKFLFTILFFTVSVLVFADAFSCQPLWAAEPAVTEKNPESEVQAAPQSDIEEKLKKIQQLLADSRAEKPEDLALQLGIPVEKFQEKTAVLQEIEAAYQRQLTALAKQSSLAQEQKNLKEQIESQQGVLVSQLPPYSLSTYDQYLDQLEKAQQREKSATETLQIDKKNLEDAHDDVNAAAQQVRLLAEKGGNDGNKADSSAQDMHLTIAKLENELAQATLDLNRYIFDNTKFAQQIAQLQKKMIQQQVDWVKSHLAYDEQDLQARLKLLDGLRQKLKSLMTSLATEQQGAEDAWLKAQQEYSDTSIDDELKKERSKSWLDARQAWRDTYQQVLEQTENSLRLISLSEDTWQRRYKIIKGDAGLDEFASWEKETTESLQNVERLIAIAQNSQSNLQTQIVSVKIQLTKQGMDPVVAKNLNTMLEALDKLLERTVEYLSRLQTMSRFQTRFLAEINARQQGIKLTDVLRGLSANFFKVLDYELWVIDDKAVTVRKAVVALMILLIGLLLAKYISHFTTNRILLRTKLNESDRAIFDRILYFLMLVLIVLFALHTVNIPLTALTFLGGAFAIGVGFGTQNLLNNFISGFILMLERPVKIGDTIEFENTIGTVEEIGIRCTRIRTASNVHILVPNSSLLEKNIVNWTLSDHIIRCQVRVGVAYGSNVREVSKLLYKAVAEHDKILKKPEPIVIFNDFGDSALIFDIYYWIRIGDTRMEKFIIESNVRFLIEKHFREGDISIPFPQRDIHLDTTQPLNLRIFQDSGDPQAKKGVDAHEQQP